MVIYGIFIMAVGKAAMHRSYLYPHNPTFGALSQGRALFLRKSRICAFFSTNYAEHASCAAIRPCPGSTFSCTDCLVHEPRRRFAPNRRWVFAEPQLEYAAYGGRNVAPRGGQEGRHQGFYLLTPTFGRVWRRLPICDRFEKEYGRGFFLPQGGAQCAPLSRHIRRVGYRTATHIWFHLRRARYNRVAQVASAL